MSKLRIVALIVVGLAFGGPAVYAQDHSGHDHGSEMKEMKEKKAHLVGEVIDVSCFTRMDGKGADHVKCAEYCIKQGAPVGILDEKSGQVYLVLPEKMGGDPKAKIMSFVGKRVEVMGKVDTKGGVKAITIEKISAVKR